MLVYIPETKLKKANLHTQLINSKSHFNFHYLLTPECSLLNFQWRLTFSTPFKFIPQIYPHDIDNYYYYYLILRYHDLALPNRCRKHDKALSKFRCTIHCN